MSDPEDDPATRALNDLWEAVILKYRPDYGDWEYPGQAFRHLRAEYEELRAALQRAERDRDFACAVIASELMGWPESICYRSDEYEAVKKLVASRSCEVKGGDIS